MARYIYDSIQDRLIPSEEYYLNKYYKTAHLQMMNGNTPVKIYYSSDEIEPTRHMANNKYYTSKKKFREATKAAGCIEIGNETSHMLKPRKSKVPDRRQRREDIKRAVWELKNGRRV